MKAQTLRKKTFSVYVLDFITFLYPQGIRRRESETEIDWQRDRDRVGERERDREMKR